MQSPPSEQTPDYQPGELATRHVFMSHVSEDARSVKRLARELEKGGVEIWLGDERIPPGVQWRTAIRDAIRAGMFFIACFSAHSAARESSYMNDELLAAIDELRQRPADRAWFLSVLLSPDTLPTIEVGGGKTLHDFQYVKLYADWETGVERLLTALRPAVRRPVAAASNAGPTRPERPAATRRSGRRAFEEFVDATLYVTEEPTFDEILRHMAMGRLIPARFLYSTGAAAEHWIRLCEDPQNQHYLEAVEFWAGPAGAEVTNLVHDQLGRDDFDYVSLGCGDGRKDADILNRWLEAKLDIGYYPYDASMPLLLRASHCVRERTQFSSRGQLRVKAVLADFNRLHSTSEIFRQRPGPNVVALLGNSLGNLEHESRLLRTIRQALSTDDLLLLEVRLNTGERHHYLEGVGDNSLRFYFGALETLGVTFDPGMMRFEIAEQVSQIRDTVTRVARYERVEVHGRAYADVTLAHTHMYAEQAFLHAVERAGFSVLYSHVGGENDELLVCVVRRKG